MSKDKDVVEGTEPNNHTYFVEDQSDISSVTSESEEDVEIEESHDIYYYITDVLGEEIDSFDEGILEILDNTDDILELLEAEIIDLYELNDLPADTLINILEEGEGLAMVEEGKIRFLDLVNLEYATQENEDTYSDVLDDFVSAINNFGEHGIEPSEIVRLYSLDKLHLEVLANIDNLNDYVYTNYEDSTMVQFVMENYPDYCDIGRVRSELGGRDGDSAALMDFDREIGTHNEPSEDLEENSSDLAGDFHYGDN